MIKSLARRRREASERGQSLVEMALLLPLLILIVIGTLEFGMLFDHHLTLEYATREGARAGAALANGGGVCGSAEANAVDGRIIAAVQRVLTSPGSPVLVDEVQEIRIYNSGNDGQAGASNVWEYTPGLGPVVDGLPLNFSQDSAGWLACNRNNSAVNTQSIGVSIAYRYNYQTPFRIVLGQGLTMVDRTVMQLNPTN